MEDVNIFICDRGVAKDLVKIQLEIPRRVLDAYKEKSKDTKYTAKQVMENMLVNWIDGVSS